MSRHRLVDHLIELAKREDRGALARLRRGLGKPPGTAVEMYPIVAPYVPEHASSEERDAAYVTAALFALHPKHSDDMRSLGHTFHAMCKRESDRAALERRFTALLNAHIDDLPGHLRSAVSLAKSKDATVNYHQLMSDIADWAKPDRRVQRRWAADFWAASADQTKEQTNSIETIKEA